MDCTIYMYVAKTQTMIIDRATDQRLCLRLCKTPTFHDAAHMVFDTVSTNLIAFD